MSTNHPKSLWTRLPVSMQQVLQKDALSPLQQWLDSACYDGAGLLRYASTLAIDDAYAVLLAATVASVIDASVERRPINLHYAIPLWHSLAQGDISTGVFVSDAPDLNVGNDPSQFSGVSTAHIALGLARGEVLDVEARAQFLQTALEDPTPIHAALVWFCIDRDVQDETTEQSVSSRFLTEWMRAFPEDRDFAIFLLRKYLASARRIGVAGALAPLNGYDQPTISPKDAAWSIAWDEAARAGAHATCAELALHRARSRKKDRALYHRWLFIYALHAEQRKVRLTNEAPVARELLDLLYEVDDPNIPAQLCASIAARTNRLEPIMREVLPYLKGPTSKLVHRGLDATTRPQAFLELCELGAAGVLLAIRIARKHPKALEAALAYTPAKAALSHPTPILDGYETNADFMREIFPANAQDSPVNPTDSTQESASTPTPKAAETPLPPEHSTAPDPPIAPDTSSASEDPASTKVHVAPVPDGNAENAAATDATTHEDNTAPPVSPHTATDSEALEASTQQDSAVSDASAADKPSPNRPASAPEDASPTPDDSAHKEGSTGPFDHTIFATLTSNEFGDDTLVPAQNDATPTVSDVLLAAFLPDALRVRADKLLAQRITPEQLDERSFVHAIKERIALLPDSAWSLAELLAIQSSPKEAKTWMKHAAKHTEDPVLRAERYRRLAKHSAQQCHDLSSAVEFLEESLRDAPCAPETIQTLDTIYTRLGRTQALRALYTRALESDNPQPSAALREQWTQRLHTLPAAHTRSADDPSSRQKP